MEHVNYPHEPGRLYDCPACEARCHCGPEVARGEAEECIWKWHGCCDEWEDEGTHDVDCPRFDPAPTHQWQVTTPDAVYETDEED